jgi:hypothetical protein
MTINENKDYKYLWECCTADKYELPVLVGYTLREIARKSGRSELSLRSSSCRKRPIRIYGTLCRIIKVPLVDGMDNKGFA